MADVNSVAKLYLINELGKNWDSGVSSTFFTYRQDENGNYKFYGSPVWDYDNSLGNAKGIQWDLRNIGVTDYEEYTGWWCQHKGKTSASAKRSNNVIARISQNAAVKAVLPRIWFERFMPALDHFTGAKYDNEINADFYTREAYYGLIKDSAAMNYESGWLLNTGSWIADHSSQKVAHYDSATQKMVVDSQTTNYAQDFEGMYNYASDWMLSRAAWLSEQFAPNYVPSPLLGDADLDGEVNIIDATAIQRHIANIITLPENAMVPADVDKDGEPTIIDVTLLQRYFAGIATPKGIGKPIE